MNHANKAYGKPAEPTFATTAQCPMQKSDPEVVLAMGKLRCAIDSNRDHVNALAQRLYPVLLTAPEQGSSSKGEKPTSSNVPLAAELDVLRDLVETSTALLADALTRLEI